MSKVTVVGAGNLGSCIAYEVANRGIVDELVLIDIYKDLAEGNAADIQQSLAFRNNTEVYAGDYQDANNSDIIVVTAGKPRTPDMKSRMDLLNVNAKIIRDVASNFNPLDGDFTLITLTNPMDLINYLMWKYTGFDRRRVIGSGGQLDSSRFRGVLSKRFGVPILDVDAFVIGEHGENQVPVFSWVKVKGAERRFTEEEKIGIQRELRESALNVISKKGATIYAPANNTANMVQAILKDEKMLAACSVVLEGEYGLRDVSIGVPVILGKGGAETVLEWQLNEEEAKLLHDAAYRMIETIGAISDSQ